MKFINGKNLFLFLDNDTNGTMSQIQGKHWVKQPLLERIYDRHCIRHLLLGVHGIPYFHVIAPSKETVLTANLPEGIKYQEFGKTPVNMYLDLISEHANTDVGRLLKQRTFYQPELLIRMYQENTVPYYKTDTHWNYAAAALYFRNFLASAGLSDALRRFDELTFDTKEVSFLGDLGIVAGSEPELVVERLIAAPFSLITYGGNIVNEGYIRHTVTPHPGGLKNKVLVIHDSFTHWLFPVISEIFSEVLYVHTPDVDFSFINQFEADYVFFIQVERFFPRLITNECEYTEMLRRKAAGQGVDETTPDYIVNLVAGAG